MEKATRRLIIDAAIELLGHDGMAGLTTRKVAQKAGVNLGLVHYYFHGKEELVREAFADFFNRQRGRLAALNEVDGDPEAALVRTLGGLLDAVLAYPGMVHSLIEFNLRAVAHFRDLPIGLKPFREFSEAQRTLVDTIRPIIRRRTATDEDAAVKTIQLFAMLFHPIVLTDFSRQLFDYDLTRPEPREQYIRSAVRMVLSRTAL